MKIRHLALLTFIASATYASDQNVQPAGQTNQQNDVDLKRAAAHQQEGAGEPTSTIQNPEVEYGPEYWIISRYPGHRFASGLFVEEHRQQKKRIKQLEEENRALLALIAALQQAGIRKGSEQAQVQQPHQPQAEPQQPMTAPATPPAKKLMRYKLTSGSDHRD